VGEVKPKAESCAAKEDENCDGHDCVQWAELFGDGADQQARALAVDASGNIFVVGTFAGAIALNGVTISSKGSTDAFVLKLDPSGKLLWGKQFGDVGTQEGQAVTVDSTGSVVVAGFSTTAFSLEDPQMKTTPAGLFVVKLNDAGTVIWSNGFGAMGCGGTVDSAIAGMAVTSGNDIALAGRYCGSIDFGNGPVMSQMASQDGFVALLGGGSGSATIDGGWSKTFGDSNQQRAVGVATDAATGEITVVGEFAGTAKFGMAGFTITSTGGYDMFLAKFLVDGTPTLALKFGDSDDQFASAVTTDTAGNIYISGNFRGTLNFGLGTVTNPMATNNAYLVKLDSTASYQWAKTLGGNNFFGATTDISIDSSSNITVAGIYLGEINFGAGPIASKGATSDIFLAKLTSSGQHVWTKTFDDGTGVLFGRMKLSPSMEPILAGFASKSTDFGTGPLMPVGSNDGFIAKFAP
jgi:hypothetical protein